MEPDVWPLDPADAASLVIRVIDDIDERTAEDDETLLAVLVSASWGASWAQNQ
jgi:hypothetical protein